MSTENILQGLGIDPGIPPSEQLKILAGRSRDVDEVQRRLELSRRANDIEAPYTAWAAPDVDEITVDLTGQASLSREEMERKAQEELIVNRLEKHTRAAEENDYVYDKEKRNYAKRNHGHRVKGPEDGPDPSGPGCGSPQDIAITASLNALFESIDTRAKELGAPSDMEWPSDKAAFIAEHTENDSEALHYRHMSEKMRNMEVRE